MPVKAIKENVSLTAGEGSIEKVIAYPRAPMHVETRNKVAVAIEEAVLRDDRPQ